MAVWYSNRRSIQNLTARLLMENDAMGAATSVNTAPGQRQQAWHATDKAWHATNKALACMPAPFPTASFAPIYAPPKPQLMADSPQDKSYAISIRKISGVPQYGVERGVQVDAGPLVPFKCIEMINRARITHTKNPRILAAFTQWKKQIYPRAFITDDAKKIYYESLHRPDGKFTNYRALYATK